MKSITFSIPAALFTYSAAFFRAALDRRKKTYFDWGVCKIRKNLEGRARANLGAQKTAIPDVFEGAAITKKLFKSCRDVGDPPYRNVAIYDVERQPPYRSVSIYNVKYQRPYIRASIYVVKWLPPHRSVSIYYVNCNRRIDVSRFTTSNSNRHIEEFDLHCKMATAVWK